LRRVKAKLNRERYRQQCIDGQLSALSKLETDVDLIMIRQPFSKEFYVVWNEALQLYR
jgi:hypothetical protein